METNGQLERWRQRYIKILCAEFPIGNYENWSKCQELFPHAQSAVAQQPKEQHSLRDWASILQKAAWYAWKMGNGVEAETMSVQSKCFSVEPMLLFHHRAAGSIAKDSDIRNNDQSKEVRAKGLIENIILSARLNIEQMITGSENYTMQW
jgi:hypothetical protein